MIITEKNEQAHFWNKILKETNRHIYRMRPDGLLEYDGTCISENFLAYADGKWYGSRFGKTGTSDIALAESNHNKFLFAITEYRYFSMLEDNTVEYASGATPLSEDAVAFLMSIHKTNLCVYMIDGSKYTQPLMLAVPAEYQNFELFALSIIALVRQYNAEAAKQMEEFWFKPKDMEDNAELFTAIKEDFPKNTARSPYCPS